MPPIKFWGLSTCIHCKKAKEFLDERDVNYDLTYVDRLSGDERQQCIDEIKKHNKALSFPTIVFDDGETVVVGFNSEELESALENCGYTPEK
ncbi:glutaredoxin family protein [Desulfohalovibrio reitneri]|uniref:glutaredoxin family protein n=1 Tax=Desulfohalovibrio reitneri TaxID=1307759 RepID=UPI0004A71D65|nr:glutaredoxin family protein [Desulfohalovibrio reitneri]